MRRSLPAFLFLVLLMLSGGAALAVQPGEMLKDPALEARARGLSENIRCLVCQNQSIDESNADLARDLRVLVRDRLTAGDSDQQVLDYLVKRYGDFVLLKPPVKASTWALWYGPAVLFVLGAIGVVVFLRGRRRATETAPLSENERRRVQALLADDDGDGGGR